jgi:hypothetical protein
MHRHAARILGGVAIVVFAGCGGSEFSERDPDGGAGAVGGNGGAGAAPQGGSAGSGTGAAGGVGGSAASGTGGGAAAGGAGSGGTSSGGSGGSGTSTGGTGTSTGGTGGLGGGGGTGGVNSCEPACSFGLTCCDGRCVNTANDIVNCGGCGKTCGGLNPHCLGSQCGVPICFDVVACIGEQVCCGSECCGGETGKICCDVPGPGPSSGPRCVEPVDGTCPIGCPGCQ